MSHDIYWDLFSSMASFILNNTNCKLKKIENTKAIKESSTPLLCSQLFCLVLIAEALLRSWRRSRNTSKQDLKGYVHLLSDSVCGEVNSGKIAVACAGPPDPV